MTHRAWKYPSCLLFSLFYIVSANFLYSVVDFSTMDNKVMVGYQGWHWAKGDGSPRNKWNHWSNDKDDRPGPNSCHFDVYPDMSEYTKKYNTDFYRGGTRFKVYSTYDYSTVSVHFRWMKEYNIDGAFVQRFIHHFIENNTGKMANINAVLNNVKNAAQEHGRAYAVMYDVSDVNNDNELINEIKSDWDWLNNNNYLNSSNYLHHDGKPVVSIWGMGLASRRPSDPAKALNLINWFKNDRGCHVMGGVADDWRTFDVGGSPAGNSKSRTEPGWVDVYEAYNVISPWMVGRIGDPGDSDHWQPRIEEDVVHAESLPTRDYMPVVFPGFSRANWYDNEPVNKYARLGGQFMWRQAYNAKRSGAKMLYIAMFDEVDEGTAIYKMAETINDCPDTLQWVTADSDGYNLPGDWYLQVSDYINQMFKGQVPVVGDLPLLEAYRPPVVTLNGSPPNNMSNSPFDVTLSVNVGTGYYSINGSSYTAFSSSSPAIVTISGASTLSYYGNNSYGSSAVESVIYTFDTVAPVIDIISGPDTDYVSFLPFSVTLSIDEDFGYWSLDGGPYNQISIQPEIMNSNSSLELGSSTAATDWSLNSVHSRSSLRAHSGQWSLRSGYRGTEGRSSRTVVSVTPNTDYIFSGWIWKDNSDGVAYIDLNDIPDDINLDLQPGEGAGQWSYVERDWNSGSLTEVTLRCVQGGGSTGITGDMFWDDVQLTGPGTVASVTVDITESTVLSYYAEDAVGNNTGVTNVNYTIRTNSPAYWSSSSFGKPFGTEGIEYIGTLTTHAFDADGDPLTFIKVAGTADWLSVLADGTLTGTPAFGDAGLNTIVVNVTDGYSPPSQATISITIVEGENPDPYQDWKDSYGILDDSADGDDDGMNALMEFALGADPTTQDEYMKPTASEGSGNIDYTFRRAESSVTYKIQKSTDLVNWIDHITVSDAHGSVGSNAVVSVSNSEMINGKLFLRLRVEN